MAETSKLVSACGVIGLVSGSFLAGCGLTEKDAIALLRSEQNGKQPINVIAYNKQANHDLYGGTCQLISGAGLLVMSGGLRRKSAK